MRRILFLLLLLVACAAPATAERLVTSISTYRVSISSNFSGADLVLFGTVERDAATVSRRGGYNLVVTAFGPRQNMVAWRKGRVLGIWVNSQSRTFLGAPSYLTVLANRPLPEIADADSRLRFQVGVDQVVLPQEIGTDIADVTRDDPFRVAFLRLKRQQGLYREDVSGVTLLTPTLFRAGITLPADVPIGTYDIDIKLFADGALITRETSAFEIYKVGIEQLVATAAREHGLLYGVSTAGLALVIGWLASVLFRRD